MKNFILIGNIIKILPPSVILKREKRTKTNYILVLKWLVYVAHFERKELDFNKMLVMICHLEYREFFLRPGDNDEVA